MEGRLIISVEDVGFEFQKYKNNPHKSANNGQLSACIYEFFFIFV